MALLIYTVDILLKKEYSIVEYIHIFIQLSMWNGADIVQNISGRGASAGIATGAAFVLPLRIGSVMPQEIFAPHEEIARLTATRAQYTSELDAIYKKTSLTMDIATANIFMVYSMFLNDGEGINNCEQKILDEHVNAEYAVYCEMKRLSNIFLDINDDYFRERCSDVENICYELILRLMGVHEPIDIPKECSDEDIIIVAEQLSPADIIGFDRNRVKGVIIYCGSVCSHTSILCRTLGLPAIVEPETGIISTGDFLKIDGDTGEIIVFK